MANKLSRERISSDHSSQSPAEKVAGNEDLLTEILLRLPVRSLIKFKSVRKQWSYLISDPQFALDHTSRTNPSSLIPSSLFFHNSLTESRDIDFVWLNDNNIPNQSPRVRAGVPSLSFLDSFFQGGIIRILHSCNGLLLCRFYTTSSVCEGGLHLCVCNPIAKTYTLLPKPHDITQNNFWIFSISLVFDPCESHHYRVVFVKKTSNSADYSIDIYSSENGLWTNSVCRFQLPSRFSFGTGSGVNWNGGIHWIGDNNFKCYSPVFNTRTNNLTLTELPTKPPQSSIQYFGAFGGHLHLIYAKDILPEQFEVLEKDRDTLEWSIRYIVDMNQIVSAFPEIVTDTGLDADRMIARFPQIAHVIRSCRGEIQEKEYAFNIMSVVERGEKKEDSELVLIVPGKVISYNLKLKTLKVLSEFPWKELPSKDFTPTYRNYDVVYPYMESLASV
ncbi:hypothetical protein LguiB_010572 [Lonicera macranthoides]